MKKFKHVIVSILATIGVLLGFFIYNTQRNKKKAAEKKIKDNIKESEEKIEDIKVEQKAVEKKRYNKKKKVAKVKTEIATLEQTKENLVVEEKPIEEAKDNILKQTRRGRPKK
jgi:septal ring factor EnvC (AmiA/AmiB activator)